MQPPLNVDRRKTSSASALPMSYKDCYNGIIGMHGNILLRGNMERKNKQRPAEWGRSAGEISNDACMALLIEEVVCHSPLATHVMRCLPGCAIPRLRKQHHRFTDRLVHWRLGCVCQIISLLLLVLKASYTFLLPAIILSTWSAMAFGLVWLRCSSTMFFDTAEYRSSLS
eukprot:353445-Chlamydomonas_euryale.AAC.12